MDCVLPSHAIRTFCSSIGTLSKIGKDLYLEFDPIEGLILHTLNDSKSAYACFRFRTTFFERCTAPPGTLSQQIQRQRKRQLNNLPSQNSGNNEDDGKYICRVPLRSLAAVVRPRKGVVSLRIRSEVSGQSEVGQSDRTSSLRSYLSFEFQLQPADTIVTVTHRVQIANETSCERADVLKDSSSELIASPSVWLRLLEPVVQRTNEVKLIIRNRSGEAGTASSVSATTFHHSTDTHQGIQQGKNSATSTNAILLANSTSMIKTETAVGCDELEEFDFVSNREHEEGMPDDVNDQIVLVFCLKEAKAMLQFCAATQNVTAGNSHASFFDQPEQAVSISFHWGGKPLVLETVAIPTNGNGDSSASPFSSMLVLATLDHSILTSERSISAS